MKHNLDRVLLIGPFPPLFSYGGPTKSILGIYNSLTNSGYNCTVLSPKKNFDGSDNVDTNNKKNIIYTENIFFYILKNYQSYDIIWFNSFFELKIFFLFFLKKLSNFKLIVSPRGQLANKAISTSNMFLKYQFIKLIRIFKNDIVFHSTESNETKDIKYKLGTNKIFQISNIFSLKYYENNCYEKKYVFYSRIHKKKGLLILLKNIQHYNEEVQLDIYGFIEDKAYWKECYKIIRKLKNVKYMGTIDDGDISILKNKYSFFILPTLNENFGHVIVELLSIGLIPMISKGTTPFDSIIGDKIKLNFSLNKSGELTNKIVQSKNLSNSEMKKMKIKVKIIYNTLEEMQVKVKKDYINFINKVSLQS